MLLSLWWWLMFFLSVGFLVCLVVLVRSDCDLVLKWYTKCGKNPKDVLHGKVIWITGASSGIGENLSYALAKSGAILVLSARREGELKRVLDQCKKYSPLCFKETHMVLPMNLTDTKRHSAHVETVLEKFNKIDILVNNAGRSQRAEAVFTDLAVDRALIDLNLLGTLSLTKTVLPTMVERRGGSLVIISSVAGKIGAPGSATYSASKHALQGYFDTLRMEVIDNNISILSVCPGPVHTPFLHKVFRESMTSDNSQLINDKDNRVSAERCAELITVGMANQLDEIWISKNPILLFLYLTQYFPNFAKWLGKRLGKKRLHAIKKGKAEVNNYFSK